MSLTKQEKNILTGLVITGVILAAIAFLFGRVTAPGQAAPGSSTAGTTSSTAAETSGSTGTSSTATTATVTVTTGPEATSSDVEVIEQSVSPATPTFGQEITFTGKVRGKPESVYISYGPAGGDIGGNRQLRMQPGATAGDVTTYSITTASPKGFFDNNQCYYSVLAYTFDSTEVKIAGEAPLFTVN